MVIIIYKDGSWILTNSDSAWEYQNDPDWLTTISISEITAQQNAQAN